MDGVTLGPREIFCGQEGGREGGDIQAVVKGDPVARMDEGGDSAGTEDRGLGGTIG